MRTALAILLLILVTTSLLVAEDGRDSPRSFYFQPIAKTSAIQARPAYWYGMQAGVMLNDHVGIGGAFNSLAQHYVQPHRHLDPDYDWYGDQLAVAYAGVVLSYSGQIGDGWHTGVSLLVGDGWTGWEHSYPDNWGNWVPPHRTRFLAFEPTFHLEADIIHSLRIVGGLGYLYAEHHGPPDWISGTMYGVGLKYLTL